MNPFGLLFLLGGVMLMRQVAVGRVHETPEDMRDIALAFLNADTARMKEVLSARGENVSAGEGTLVAGDFPADTPDSEIGPMQGPSASALANRVVMLGMKAKGYRLGATGPEYYDCSGLIWRAAKDLKIYNGPRFTTSTFAAQSVGWASRVTTPTSGDIVLWTGDHMGIMVRTDTMYSARSVSKGIGESSISGDSSYFGRQPTYWRVK